MMTTPPPPPPTTTTTPPTTTTTRRRSFYSILSWMFFQIIGASFIISVLIILLQFTATIVFQDPVKKRYDSNYDIIVFDNEEEEGKGTTTHALTSILATQNGLDTDTNFSSTTTIHTSRDYYYLRNRTQYYESWFEGNETIKLKPNADENGTIIDFIIAGFAKCGTTSMQSNLGQIAPMPVGDVCTPIHKTVYYAYFNWPKEQHKKKHNNEKEKLYRGTKCPAYIHGTWLREVSDSLPRAKLIVGIRHPMLWFQSFWNMLLGTYRLRNNIESSDPYHFTKPCRNRNGFGCRSGCPKNQIICLNKGRFHHSLAMLGKTALSDQEIELLGPNDPDGGKYVQEQNNKIRNPIFLYEQQMLGHEYLWQDLTTFLGLEDHPLQNDSMIKSHGKYPHLRVNFCNDTYDNLRAKMMPIAYNVSIWLQNYFVPLAKNKTRSDVFIPRPDEFYQMVESYKVDPCGKLERLKSGQYVISKKQKQQN